MSVVFAQSPYHDLVDLLFIAMSCGATVEVAAKFAVNATQDDWNPARKYRPRNDPEKWTPRLPEKQWWPLRGKVFRRDGYLCAYCKDEDGPFEIDHIVPVTRGGSNELENLCVACKPCNSSKGDRLLSEWRGRYR
jgi:hypothetical protein